MNFSLSIYRISINKRLSTNEMEWLSDYDCGKDFLVQLDQLFQGWKFEKTQKNVPAIAKDEEEKKISRILKKPDGSFEYYSLGRCLSGIIESGEFGTEENIIDSITGELKYRKTALDAQMIPFFFMFNIPEHSSYGYLVIEKIGNNGIYSVLKKAIEEHVGQTLDENLVLKINPFMLPEVYDKNMSVVSDAKKVILRNAKSRNLTLSDITENLVEGHDDLQTDIVFKAPRNGVIPIRKWLDKLNSSKKEREGYTFQGIEYADVAFELMIGGKVKTVSIAKIIGLGTNLEVTDNVSLGDNGYPTYESLKNEALKLVSYIKDE